MLRCFPKRGQQSRSLFNEPGRSMKKSAGTAIWGIHAGKTGEADSLFLQKDCVALGWSKMGDLSSIKADREAFKARVAQVYPEKKSAAVANNAGQLFRFLHEMKQGDLVVYPSKSDRQVHLGRVVGDYRYSPNAEAGYPQVRAVRWLRSVPRTRFSQGALYEIGSAMSLFLVKNYADEFRAAVEGEAVAPVVAAEDESVAAVTEDIEQSTRDFVIKQLAQMLKGHPFAAFVAQLLNCMGYRTRVSEEGPDGGIDIVAHKDALGLEPPIIKVQVKSTESTVGDPTVSALYGKVTSGEFGLVVTLGGFSPQAQNFAKSKGNLRLIDGEELVDLIFEHYDKLDSRYKGLLPLKRVYVPEAVDNESE